eukprot:TRINITY_DN3927_c0_g1_i1.p1 TRINITY_DN3927_c0_g1~~TRINITY_DN3927_c0_g1_i1.p1  ORF type:complete len:486 (+),score=139.30 TRINITY_DN3927_c0_g1_i1:84-1460(+)
MLPAHIHVLEAMAGHVQKEATQPRPGQPRLPCGTLQDWPQWAASHPQREEPVSVVTRGGLVCEGGNQLSVASWNVLSPRWASYWDECDTADMLWENRHPRFVAWVRRMNADIVMLQEVDHDRFEQFYKEPFADVYEAVMMQPTSVKRGADGVPEHPGCATLFRKDKLTKLWEDHHARTLGVGLALPDGRRVAALNVHLDANQQDVKTRVDEMHSQLRGAMKYGECHAVILGGDFNTGADSSLAHCLRSTSWFGIRLASAYEHPDAEKSTPACRATICHKEHRYMIDHLYFEASRCKLLRVMEPIDEDEMESVFGEQGLPNSVVPSDHMPVGMVVEVGPDPEPFPDDYSELWDWKSNPLTDEQRATFLALEEELPTLPKSHGPPPKEEQQMIKRLREERKKKRAAFDATLSPDAAFVVAVLRLQLSRIRKSPASSRRSSCSGRSTPASPRSPEAGDAAS